VKTTTVSRIGDMHPNRGIQLQVQNNGDVILSITESSLIIEGKHVHDRASVEFCLSGGRSRHTLHALHALFIAIELDNSQRPQEITN
jgi:archaellum component FlaF (FlaF/FlaG flagellin family)